MTERDLYECPQCHEIRAYNDVPDVCFACWDLTYPVPLRTDSAFEEAT